MGSFIYSLANLMSPLAHKGICLPKLSKSMKNYSTKWLSNTKKYCWLIRALQMYMVHLWSVYGPTVVILTKLVHLENQEQNV